MLVKIGNYKNRSVENLIIKEPLYIGWVLEQKGLSGPLLEIQEHASKLVEIFDEKEFVDIPCSNSGCDSNAEMITFYGNNTQGEWRCNECYTSDVDRNNQRIQAPISYMDILYHVKCYCKNSKVDCRKIVRLFAEAKNLPNRVGEKQLQEFFNVSEIFIDEEF